MLSFKKFLQDNMKEEKSDIKKTLSKIPHSHAKLIQGYNLKFHSGNTLNGDDEHIGYIDDNKKEIAISGPWNYGREFTILHEVGHKVWEKYVATNSKLVNKWIKIISKTKNKQNQEPEELFCHAYANFYVKNKIVIHHHPSWQEFISNLPQ